MKNDLYQRIISFRDERNWKQFHTGENLAKALSIEAAELLELYQWKQEVDDVEKVKEELADILIYATLIADAYKIDMDKIVEDKIKKNEEKYPVDKAFGKSNKYDSFK